MSISVKQYSASDYTVIEVLENEMAPVEVLENETAQPSAQNVGPVQIVAGPEGPQGKQGEPGKTPNIQIGEVVTLEAGTEATASITGTTEEPRLNLGIPQGKQGEPGKTPNIQIGEVVTLEAGTEATANITGTTEEPRLNLGIPQGKQGKPFTYEDFTPEQLEALKGSDANVTSENIKKALGYNPANEEDIPTIPANVSAFNNDAGYITKKDIPEAPVQSVNGKTGAVQLAYGDVGADKAGKAVEEVGKHNVDENAHNDIRIELTALRNALEAFLDIDDPTLDQLSELIQKIEANAGTITELTNGKVNVSDIVNDLVTNVANKPLSAAQGVVLKKLVDELRNTSTSAQNIAVEAFNKADEALIEATDAKDWASDAVSTALNANSRAEEAENKVGAVLNTSVRFDVQQNLSETYKAQARNNIGSPSKEELEEVAEEINSNNVLNPDSFEGTDTEKLQACFDKLATNGGIISINRTYTLTNNIKIKHDSGSSNQIIVKGTGEVAGIEFGNYSFVGYDETPTGYGGVVFEHLRLNGEGIGFNCNYLIRLFFNSCVIRYFSNFVYADSYIQTVYFNNCAIRYSQGATIKVANNADSKCFDVRICGCLAEWGVSLFDAPNIYGCSIVQNCIEGFTDTPIIVRRYLYMLDISSNYFEKNGNGVSVDFSGIGEVSSGNISNNSFIENGEGRKGSILLPSKITRSLIICGNAGTNVVEVPTGASDLTGVFYFANIGGVINTEKKLTPINPSDIISMLGSGVVSVNGETGKVVLSAEDVGATTEGYVNNAIANLNAQGIQQTFCMAQGTTLEECLAWLEANGDKTKAYIMPGNVSDEVYGYLSKRTEVEVPGCTNQVEGKLLINHRISASGTPGIRDADGMVTSATPDEALYYIPVKGGDVIRVNRAIDPGFKSGYARVIYCNLNHEKVSDYADGTAVSQVKMTEKDGVTSWTVGYKSDGSKMSSFDTIGAMLINITINGSGTAITENQVADLVLTVNEEIKEGHTEIIDTYSWESTGHKFIK